MSSKGILGGTVEVTDVLGVFLAAKIKQRYPALFG